MQKTFIITGITLLVVVAIVSGQILFKNTNILHLGAEKSLQITRSKIEKALPETYPADKIRKEFDAVLDQAKAGQINSGELKNFLLWLPTQLNNTQLDSVEVDRLIAKLQQVVEVQQK